MNNVFCESTPSGRSWLFDAVNGLTLGKIKFPLVVYWRTSIDEGECCLTKTTVWLNYRGRAIRHCIYTEQHVYRTSLIYRSILSWFAFEAGKKREAALSLPLGELPLHDPEPFPAIELYRNMQKQIGFHQSIQLTEQEYRELYDEVRRC